MLELLESTASRDVDRQLRWCTETIHAGLPITFEQLGLIPSTTLATSIEFPTSSDSAYAWFD